MGGKCHPAFAILLPLSLFSMAFGQKEITAYTGQTVVLPCGCASVSIAAIKWSRPKMREKCICSYGRSDPEALHPSFDSRADCRNGTLHLTNVTHSDMGLYRCQCTIKEDGEIKKENVSDICLRVKDHRMIPARIGESVLVPCGCPSSTVGIKWSKLEPTRVACFYRNGKSDLDAQHPSYEGRADCRNGTLHLKNVSHSDMGLYQCQCLKDGGPAGPPQNISLYDQGTGTLGNTTAGDFIKFVMKTIEDSFIAVAVLFIIFIFILFCCFLLTSNPTSVSPPKNPELDRMLGVFGTDNYV